MPTLLYQTFFFFFFNDTATTEIYTLSLHDALPIYGNSGGPVGRWLSDTTRMFFGSLTIALPFLDRKSTRMNSSHEWISYAVFCLKKKKERHAALCVQIQTRISLDLGL